MESWMIQLIISLGGVIVTLASVIGYLKTSKPNNPNGVKALEKEFRAKTMDCGKKFEDIARESGGMAATLISIDGRLESLDDRTQRIEDKLSKRR